MIDNTLHFLYQTKDPMKDFWISNPILKIPNPNSLPGEDQLFEMNGKGVGTCSNDPFNLYTTAIVIKVLNKYLMK